MAEKKKIDMLQPVTDDTRTAARELLDNATYASIATIDPKTGHPMCSRIGFATDSKGHPVFIMSSLSGHHAALVNHPETSLLIGEPGSGDPLAHERISLFGTAVQVQDEEDRASVRTSYLSRNPKSKLYVDLNGFTFWRLLPERAGYVVGFGKAYALTSADLNA